MTDQPVNPNQQPVAQPPTNTNANAAALAAIQANPLAGWIMTIILGGSAVGGFAMNNSQWNDVSADIKAMRSDIAAVNLKFASFETQIEAIKRLDTSLAALRTEIQATNKDDQSRIRELENKVMRLELEIETIKKALPGAR